MNEKVTPLYYYFCCTVFEISEKYTVVVCIDFDTNGKSEKNFINTWKVPTKLSFIRNEANFSTNWYTFPTWRVLNIGWNIEGKKLPKIFSYTFTHHFRLHLSSQHSNLEQNSSNFVHLSQHIINFVYHSSFLRVLNRFLLLLGLQTIAKRF